eukprot:130996-Rhodomonas_salina.5
MSYSPSSGTTTSIAFSRHLHLEYYLCDFWVPSPLFRGLRFLGTRAITGLQLLGTRAIEAVAQDIVHAGLRLQREGS